MKQLSKFCGKQKVLWNYIRLTVLILPWFLAGGTGAGSGLSANLSGSFEEAIEPHFSWTIHKIMRNIIVLLKVITIFVLQAVEHCVYGIYNKILYELFTLRASRFHCIRCVASHSRWSTTASWPAPCDCGKLSLWEKRAKGYGNLNIWILCCGWGEISLWSAG